MKCIIVGGNIKLFAKAIQMLSKIGDEMFVQPLKNYLSFRSVNGSNSAFSDITFQENFFSYYAYESSEESDSLRCKILIRSALAVFKTPSILDKQVESCHINLQENDEQLCLILKYKNSVMKTHLLPILDTETIKANYRKEGAPNHLKIQPKVMSDVVQNFSPNILEITIEVLKEKVLIRNYIEESSNISNETRTQLVFGAGEFDEYQIDSDASLTFCLKELRAVMHFAEALTQPIEICFERPGRPIVFITKSSSIECNLVLATLNPVSDTASQSTVSTRPNIPKKVPVKRPSKTKGCIKSLSKKYFKDNNKINTISANSTEIINTESVERISDFPDTPFENNQKNTPDSSRNGTSFSTSKIVKDSKSKENSSSLLKRKPEDDNEDLVQNSPPRKQSKTAKHIFQKCFQTTFDPRSLPGYNDVEVEDSGESDNGSD